MQWCRDGKLSLIERVPKCKILLRFQSRTPSLLQDSTLPSRVRRCNYGIRVEHCPNCGGSLKIIAAIEHPPVIVKILSHLGLPARAPPRTPAQRFDLFQTA